DGFVSFALRGGPARVPGLVAMVQYMNEHGMAPESLRTRDWKSHNLNLLDQTEIDALSRPFATFFLTKTMAELYDAACAPNLRLAPINPAREILASPQLAAREFFVDVEYRGRGALRYPGAVAITTSASGGGARIGIRRPAPELGEHTAEVLAELG